MIALESSKPFRMLKPVELTALRQIARERKVSAGQDVFKEGDNGDGVYVVGDGLIEISVKMSENVRRAFYQVPPGELFGEMAVLEMKPRSASATAAKDSTVYFIPRAELLLMIERSPELALGMLREISQRLREFRDYYRVFMHLSSEMTHRQLKPKEKLAYAALKKAFERATKSRKRADREFLSEAATFAKLPFE